MKTKKYNFKMKRKNKLVCVLISMMAILFISCDKGDDDSESTPTAETPAAVSEANITLTAGGQEFKIIGPCGWASVGGTKYIGANHAENNLRAFSTYFNILELPTTTTTYTLVEDTSDENPAHITLNITEISGTKITAWNSSNTSGTLTIVVTGNKYTVDLTGIVLAANSPSSGFENGNIGAFANNGTLSGTLTFYKK
jgi:hypothetical protein